MTFVPATAAALPALLALLALAVLAAPPVAGAAEPGEDAPPVVSNGSVVPSSLPYLGGTVTISADVADVDGVTSVYAELSGSDGSYQAVTLSPAGGDAYSGTAAIGPNFTDTPASHGVSIVAEDVNGHSTSEGIGEISVDAEPQFDEAPIASDPSVEPRELPAAGGAVTIGVTATDNRGISEVGATVSLPGGGSAAVTLEPISSSRFEGTYVVPPNTGTTPQQYAIEITAYDDIGQPGTVGAGTVTVAAASRCPRRMPPWAAAKARCGRAG